MLETVTYKHPKSDTKGQINVAKHIAKKRTKTKVFELGQFQNESPITMP